MILLNNMKKNKKDMNRDSKIRTTKEGTKVRILNSIGKGIYLAEAITRTGIFTTQVTDEDLL